MPRLFIGIPLPDAYQDLLTPLVERLDACLDSTVRWSRPGNWHLTLKFLGNVDDDRVESVANALSAIDFPEFDIRAGEYGGFPDLNRPSVLWLGINKGGRTCGRLAVAVDEAMAGVGFERETREFRPHLTLGRVKRPVHDKWEFCLRKGKGENWPGFRVDHFVLWQSVLDPQGAIHTPLATFPLAEPEN